MEIRNDERVSKVHTAHRNRITMNIFIMHRTVFIEGSERQCRAISLQQQREFCRYIIGFACTVSACEATLANGRIEIAKAKTKMNNQIAKMNTLNNNEIIYIYEPQLTAVSALCMHRRTEEGSTKPHALSRPCDGRTVFFVDRRIEEWW